MLIKVKYERERYTTFVVRRHGLETMWAMIVSKDDEQRRQDQILGSDWR